MSGERHASMASDRDELLDGFFMPLGATVSARDYFEATFVEPPGFGELVRALDKPEERLILLEGQGRAGKTWTAVAAVAELLKKRVAEIAWSAGEDSHAVYEKSPFFGGEVGGESRTVAEGLASVRRFVEECMHPRKDRAGIVLLDDFFGTSWLRRLGHEEDYPFVSSLLFGREGGNGFWKWLAQRNLKILLTGRSSVLATAAITLGRRPVELHEHFLSFPRGVFARRDLERDLTDADEEWLREIERVHRAFVRDHPEFNMPAIVALLPGAERSGILRPHDALFGDDLRELSYKVQGIQEQWNATSEDGREGGDLSRRLTELDRMYLLYLAPALMFPAHGVEALVGGREEALSLRFALKLTTEPSGELAHRVPNGLYLQAVREHVRSHEVLALLAGILRRERERIWRSGSREDAEKKHNQVYHWRVALRGSLEAVLDFDDWRSRSSMELRGGEKEPICPEMIALARETEDVLLQFLAAVLSNGKSGVHDSLVETILRYPGLASSIGWLMARFRYVRAVVASADEALLDRVSRCLEEVLDKEAVSREKSDWWPASFSSLLRWVTEFDREPHDKSFLGRLLDCYVRLNREGPELSVGFRDQIAMVAEDALIWADCLPEPVTVAKLAAAVRLREELVIDTRIGSSQTRDHRSRWRIANRLFSLAWHNEWREQAEESFFANVLADWARVLSDDAMTFAREDPTLLDANLRYHWVHMIAQWAVWTRDWCFQDDPIEYERNRAANGCKEPEENSCIEELLLTMLASAVEGDGCRERARHASFLLGTRVSRCPRPERFAEAIRAVGAGINERRGEGFIRAGGGVLQGVWELGRQGYLVRETVGRHSVPEAVRCEIRQFIQLSRSALERGELWGDYREDLRRNTYLEGVPTGPEDLELCG